MQTHRLTLRRLLSWEQKVSVFAVTEHMFFGEGRIDAFREMICSETEEEREKALEKVLPYQQGDFEELYEALEGNPVTIRFLDPPLHESFRLRKRTSETG